MPRAFAAWSSLRDAGGHFGVQLAGGKSAPAAKADASFAGNIHRECAACSGILPGRSNSRLGLVLRSDSFWIKTRIARFGCDRTWPSSKTVDANNENGAKPGAGSQGAWKILEAFNTFLAD